MNKSLKIIGEGANNTTVWNSGSVFDIYADNVTVSGFTVDCGVTLSVALYDCHGCNISNNIMHGGLYTILLYRSSNNIVAHNDIFTATNGWGIFLYPTSDNNIIRANEVTGAREGIGIFVLGCVNNKLEHNKVRGNYNGIAIDGSSNNVIKRNIVENNRVGIALGGGSGNRIYHNNLMNNPDDVWDTGRNVWDNGAEVNYWDDYNGTDLDGDGIGDTYLPWEGVDYYPLIAPWTLVRTFYVSVNETVYPVTIYSYSTIASFGFNESLGCISFNATGPHNVQGFCNVTVPKTVLDEHLLVLVDAGIIDFTQVENETYNCVWFTYTHSTHRIRITEYTTPIMGDLNYDGRVNLYDIVTAAAAYNSRLGDPNWNPIADVARQWGIIDIYDLVTIASHYGETYQS